MAQSLPIMAALVLWQWPATFNGVGLPAWLGLAYRAAPHIQGVPKLTEAQSECATGIHLSSDWHIQILFPLLP